MRKTDVCGRSILFIACYVASLMGGCANEEDGAPRSITTPPAMTLTTATTDHGTADGQQNVQAPTGSSDEDAITSSEQQDLSATTARTAQENQCRRNCENSGKPIGTCAKICAPKPDRPSLDVPQGDANFHDCWVAFVHGSGDDYHDNPSDSASYWTAPLTDARLPSDSYAMHTWVTNRGRNCHYRYIGYHGYEAFFSDANHVAAQMRDFINAEGIPDGKLVIVTHSMGGLVVRYLLNMIEPNSPLGVSQPAEAQDDFALLRQKVSHAITIQAPHWGSEAADAVYGEASVLLGDITAFAAIHVFGMDGPSNARYSMRRRFIGSALSWLGDAGRTTPIWTVAGTDTDGNESAVPFNETDDKLALASKGLFGGWVSRFPNDGLVEGRSAQGISIGKESGFFGPDYGDQYYVQGAFHSWTTSHINHNHGRYSDLKTRFFDDQHGVEWDGYLGDKIRLNGLRLPCSEPAINAGCANTGSF